MRVLKRIDRLIGIANDQEQSRIGCEQPDELLFEPVQILKFVDENILWLFNKWSVAQLLCEIDRTVDDFFHHGRFVFAQPIVTAALKARRSSSSSKTSSCCLVAHPALNSSRL